MEKKFSLYNSGNGAKSIRGIGIITTQNTNVTFNPVSEHICIITPNTSENIKCHFIRAYAPTLENTVRNPDETHIFCEQLSSSINSIEQRDSLIIGGDFNAKTKLQVLEMENQLVVGKYAKSKVNENGNFLIEFCKLHNLLITNTIFKHKPSHQTTWISPLPPTFPRKNPYRNQIDYILLRKNMNSKIFGSRSFYSNFTGSDHKPVTTKIQIKWTYTKKATGTRSFNLSKLQNTQVAENYMKQVNEIIKTQTSTTSNQEEWNNITKALKASAEKNLGYNHKEKKSRDPKILQLSSIQKDINIKLNSIKDEQKKKLLKKERNKIMTQIHNIIKDKKNDNIKYALEDLERNENDTMKMYEAVKKIKRLAPKEKLIIKTKERPTLNEKEQSEIIAKYFKNFFYTNAKPMQNVLPTPMSTLFTSSEIRKAVWTLKNNKSPRMDQINVELIKYHQKLCMKKSQLYTTILQPQGSTQMKSSTEF